MQLNNLRGKVPVPLKSIDPPSLNRSPQKQFLQNRSVQKNSLKGVLASKDESEWQKPSEVAHNTPKVESATEQSHTQRESRAHQLQAYGWMSVQELSEQLRQMRWQLMGLNSEIAPRLQRYAIGSASDHKQTAASIQETSEAQLVRQLAVNRAVLRADHSEAHQMQLLISNLDSKDYLAELMEAIEQAHQGIRVAAIHNDHQRTHLHRMDLAQTPSYAHIRALQLQISFLNKSQKQHGATQLALDAQLLSLKAKYQDVQKVYKEKLKLYQEANLQMQTKQQALQKQISRIKANCQSCFKSKRINIEQIKKENNLLKKQCLEIDFRINELRQRQNNTQIEIERILPALTRSPVKRTRIKKEFKIVQIGERIVKVNKKDSGNIDARYQQRQNRNWRSYSIDV